MKKLLSVERSINALIVALATIGAFALFINLPRLAQANGVQQVITIDDVPNNPNEQGRPTLFVASPQHDSVVTSNTVNYSARFSWINCGNVPTNSSIKVYEKISGGKIANANNSGDWRLLDQKSISRGKTCYGCDERTNTSLELNGTFQLPSLVSGGSTTLWTVGDSRGSWRGALLYDFTYVNMAAAPTPTPTPVPTPTCSDHIDNDHNGFTDAADSSCHTDHNPGNPNSYNPNGNEGGVGNTCADSIDNNHNGLIDGADPICHTDGNANNPSSYDGNRYETTSPTPTPTPTATPTPIPTAKQCINGIDDDGDGKIDAADSSCHTDFNPANTASYDPTINDEGRGGNGTCNDSRDNNHNGLIDGADPICHTDGNAHNPGSFDGNRNETGTTPTPTPTATPTATPCSNCGGGTTIVTENNVVVVTGNDNGSKDTIELFKTDDHETVKPGEALTYRIVVRNNKDHDLTNVKIIDRLPAYLSPLATQPSASADANSRTITWNNQTISANSEVTFSLRVRVDQSAPNGFLIQNVAIINGDGIRANTSDSTLVQGAVPQIAGATISAPQAVPVSAKTGVPFDVVSMLFSFSGTVATAGTLIAKRFI